MQEKDNILKDYEKDNARFCDLVNGVLAGGQPLMRAEKFEALPTELLKILETPVEEAEPGGRRKEEWTEAEDAPSSRRQEEEWTEAGEVPPGRRLKGERAAAGHLRSKQDYPAKNRRGAEEAPPGRRLKGEWATAGRLRSKQDYPADSRRGELRKIKTIDRFRDIAKKYCTKDGYIIIAIQNQSKVDFGMPLRVMLEDALEYDVQRRLCKNERLHKKDRLMEVITIVLYHGSSPWTGAADLSEIIDVPQELKELERYKPSYPIVLVTPETVDVNCFHSEWREIFEILKRQNSEEEMLQHLQANRERYDALTDETIEVLFALTGRLEYYKEKKEKGEKASVFKAFTDHYNSGVKEGYQKGLQEGEKNGERRGERRGVKRGVKYGEQRLQRLITAMTQGGESALLPRLGVDAPFLTEMYRKYHI